MNIRQIICMLKDETGLYRILIGMYKDIVSLCDN